MHYTCIVCISIDFVTCKHKIKNKEMSTFIVAELGDCDSDSE